MKLGIFFTFVVCFAASVSGRRVTEMMIAQMRSVRPCTARLIEVRIELIDSNDITSDPHYIPECTADGKTWRPAQCDHDGEGNCFCVHEDSGEIIAHTKNKIYHKEAMQCGKREVKSTHVGHQCFHMQDEFNHMQETWDLHEHVPLFYYPRCTEQGKFKALQANDMGVFCVDRETGEIIPETTKKANEVPPLTEYVCQAYGEVWNKFQNWTKEMGIVSEKNTMQVDKNSCKRGFIFSECGCPRKCTSNTKPEKDSVCECKPVCLCPDNMYDLEGKCVTLEACHEAKPQSSVPQQDKLNKLTNGLWNEYKRKNPNAVIDSYNTIGLEEIVYAGGPIAYDQNPHANSLLTNSPPPEEPLEGRHFGAERIPGEDMPLLRQLLHGGTPPPEEEYNEELDNESYREEEERRLRKEYESRMRQQEENRTLHEAYRTRINNVQEETEPGFREEYQENGQQNRVHYYDAENIQNNQNLQAEEEENNQEQYNEEETTASNQEEYREETGNEVDERLIDRLLNHQNREEERPTQEEEEFSSVPSIDPEEEFQDAPCNETEDTHTTQSQVGSKDNEQDREEIERVLTENGEIPPVEANFEKSTQSVKKNSG